MHALERALRPKTIAVIGGGFWCVNVIEELRKIGFAGHVQAVHPTRDEVAGCAAVPNVMDLAQAPDVAFVGVNRTATIDIIRDLSGMGAGGAVCFASGFSETEDGGGLQAALVDAAGDMPILGPNCYGFINALDRALLWPDQHGLVPVERGVAIISQSSNIAINLTMQARGLPIAYMMTVGNQAQVGLSQIGEALISHPRVTAIGLHIEGVDDLAAFEAFAKKAYALGKPIVALKVGRSDEARAATVSHTASLAGSAAGASALFARLGIAEVKSLSVLLETLKFLHVVGPLPSANIAALSCSGGEASLIADAAAAQGVRFPALTDPQKKTLNDALGPKVTLANPLDYHTYIWGDVDAMAAVFGAMVMGNAEIGIIVLDLPRADRCVPDEWLKVIDAIALAKESAGKPLAILATLPETMPETVADDLVARGIMPFIGMEDAMAVIRAAAFLGQFEVGNSIHIPLPADNPVTLSESEAKAALKGYGVRIPKSAIAGSPSEAASSAEQIGFPIALKGQGIAHKTEAGAVALNLTSTDEVETIAGSMPTSSFLVEEMVTGSQAELLIGIVRDPAHGYVLTLAAGGVLTELLEGSVSLIVPANETNIAAALKQLKLSKVLQGYRGRPPCDLDAIIETVMTVQAYVSENPVEEVEINPLMCGADFAIAADAIITRGGNHVG